MIKKFKKDLMDIIIKEFNESDKNNEFKNNIIDPMILYIFDKFYPYLIISCIVIILMFILLLLILVLIIRSLN